MHLVISRHNKSIHLAMAITAGQTFLRKLERVSKHTPKGAQVCFMCVGPAFGQIRPKQSRSLLHEDGAEDRPLVFLVLPCFRLAMLPSADAQR